ncbi:MAG TPA: DUF4129 domain-containing protein [Bryobacteraceae bacterium]|nr:DUF4129 domain-containing protein [Bryobacteraceae bacterium]
MAEPLTRDRVVPLLEDAVRLLRQAPLSTLLCHSAGCIPFALLVLWFWNDLTNPRTLDSTGVIESFALTLMLVWMNSWRAVFAGRLRRQLTGVSDSPWTARRVFRLAAGQSFFGATRLVILPVAWLTMFPLAATVAFYRNLAVIADRDDLDPLLLGAKARRLASIHIAQSWALLPLLAFLYLLLTLNLALVLAILPQIVRILTGNESVFSRSGTLFASNPLFFLLVIAVSWIAFDPFVQAVYCVRCFRAESSETGEDLRAGLRRIRAGVQAAAAALLFVALASHSLAAVSPADLERSVRQTMQSHEYDWRLPPAGASASKASWWTRLADHLVAGVKAVSGFLGDAIRRLLRWLSGSRTPMPRPGAPPSGSLHGTLYAAIGVVVLAAAVILWRRWQDRGRTPASAPAASATVVRLDAEDLLPDRLPEERWLQLAAECLRDENYRLALRALYLANLAWLGRAGFLTIDAGKTDREYEMELKRRTRAFPDAPGLFAGNVAAFERAWYGLHDVAPEDLTAFRRRIGRMKEILPA